MKNRLLVAKDLLRKDGAIFVQIDHHQVAYLMVLMDEIFGIKNKVQLISVKTASPAGFKTVNPGPIEVTEYILFYTRDRNSFKFKKSYVPVDYDDNYKYVIDNLSDKPENWKLIHIRDAVYKNNGIEIGKNWRQSNKNAKLKWGDHWKTIRDQLIAKYALENRNNIVSIRDPHKPPKELELILEKSKNEKNKIFVYQKASLDENDESEASNGYVVNGGALSFYSNKVKEVDGKTTPTELLTDFWNDISWDGIAKEGGVKLKNGKKPEKLIKRIIEIVIDNKDDIVLDYHVGSGTTCAVAHKMECKYIGIEQLDYGEDDSKTRLAGVVNGDSSGISEMINWKGGGNFIYCELQKYNEAFIDKIKSAKSTDELIEIWKNISQDSFLNWYVNPEVPQEAIEDFIEIGKGPNGFENQKQLLMELLNKNQLYVNLSEMEDKRFKVSEEDKKLNREFYEDVNNG